MDTVIKDKSGRQMIMSNIMAAIAAESGWDSGKADENLAQALEKARTDEDQAFQQQLGASGAIMMQPNNFGTEVKARFITGDTVKKVNKALKNDPFMDQ